MIWAFRAQAGRFGQNGSGVRVCVLRDRKHKNIQLTYHYSPGSLAGVAIQRTEAKAEKSESSSDKPQAVPRALRCFEAAQIYASLFQPSNHETQTAVSRTSVIGSDVSGKNHQTPDATA